MKEINYWEQFTKSGKVEHYLSFKSCDQEQVERKAEDESYAGFSNGNRDCDQDSAYR